MYYHETSCLKYQEILYSYEYRLTERLQYSTLWVYTGTPDITSLSNQDVKDPLIG